MPTFDLLPDELSSLANAEGFDLAGIAALDAADEQGSENPRKYLEDWIAAGHAGEMEYLKRRNEQGELLRSQVQAAIPWARSVIVCAASYNAPGPLSIDPAPPTTGWIARYAWAGRPDATGGSSPPTITTPSSPACAPSRPHCTNASAPLNRALTWIPARSSSAISPDRPASAGPPKTPAPSTSSSGHGSSSAASSLRSMSSLPVAQPRRSTAVAPAAAASRPAPLMPSSRPARWTPAAASLTSPLKSAAHPRTAPRSHWPPGLRLRYLPGGVPLESESEPKSETIVRPNPVQLVNPALEWLASLNAEAFNQQFRGSPVKRTKRSGLLRNVAIAMGNSGEQEFLTQLEAWSTAEDPVLAEAATWAITRLSSF